MTTYLRELEGKSGMNPAGRVSRSAPAHSGAPRAHTSLSHPRRTRRMRTDPGKCKLYTKPKGIGG